MSSTRSINPKRGEIWVVDLDPTQGSELDKKRPVVVISSDGVGRLPIKLVAPITEWKDHYSQNIWHVKIMPNALNGLDKASAVDALQVRCISVERFIRKRGHASTTIMEEITAAIAAIIEHA